MELPLLSLSVAAFVAGAASTLVPSAQEGEAPAPAKAQSTVHPVVTALAKSASGPLHMVGSVTEFKPKGGDGMIVFGFGGDMESPFGGGFEGEIEVARTAEGEVIVVSKKTAPGFVLYDDGSTRLVELLHGDKKARLGSSEAELMTLLDFAGLMTTVRKTIAKGDPAAASQDAATGKHHLELPKALLSPPQTSGAGFVMPMTRVLKLDAALEIDGETGGVHSMTFDVLRNDPFGMMVAPAEFEVEMDDEGGIVIDGEREVVQGVAVDVGFQELDDTKEGATTRYEFTVAPDPAHSRRLKRALDRMRENVEEIDQQR